MTERWVVNASPLIVLARIGYERLLLDLPDEVLVPQPVAAEIEAGLPDDPARRALAAGLFSISEMPAASSELLAWDLGRGETSVLATALSRPGWTVILDDGAARRCARVFSLPLKGTLAIVLLARKRELIPSAGELLRSLRLAGFRLDDVTIRQALAQVNEAW